MSPDQVAIEAWESEGGTVPVTRTEGARDGGVRDPSHATMVSGEWRQALRRGAAKLRTPGRAVRSRLRH